MGIYLNPDAKRFKESLASKIYVDKTGLIAYTNSVINTEQKFVCVSRPRRFGKSMAIGMLSAYYNCELDSRSLFLNLKIANDPLFEQYLNKYEVIHIDMQEFLSQNTTIDEMLKDISKSLLWELTRKFPDIAYFDKNNLIRSMRDIYAATDHTFIILIDEWDCLFREFKEDKEGHKKYLDFLRTWIKEKPYVALAYMTGILPIKKYGSHSALNMFSEFSMTAPRGLAEYVGFTESEVQELCRMYQMDFDEMKAWYDGYAFANSPSVYSPKSVIEALTWNTFDTYWNQTETYEALKIYIKMNYDGLKDAVIEMMLGQKIVIDTGSFQNDMTTFTCRDDVLTLLVHLGYLSYNSTDNTVCIPNREILCEYDTAIKHSGWQESSMSCSH